MPWLLVNGSKYSLDELAELIAEENSGDFEKSTLEFCQAWLKGQKEFAIQTSGSTGPPKSIVLRREQIEASATQTIAALQLRENETALVCLDTKYIAGQMMLARGLIAGMNIVAVSPTSNPFHNLNNLPIDFVALVPYQLQHILDHALEKINQVRCAIIGGAAMNHALKERVQKIRCEIYATYGMTETISHVALQRLNGNNPQDYFEAFQSTHLRVDSRGCLCIKTEYLHEEIITNDLIQLLSDRKFRWLGRIDNIINSGGIKVIPEKVESVLEKILDSFQIKNRFFVAELPHEKLGSQVTVVVEGSPFNNETRNEILAKAGRELSKYELPKEFLFVQQFQTTPTGKINRIATMASVR